MQKKEISFGRENNCKLNFNEKKNSLVENLCNIQIKEELLKTAEEKKAVETPEKLEKKKRPSYIETMDGEELSAYLYTDTWDIKGVYLSTDTCDIKGINILPISNCTIIKDTIQHLNTCHTSNIVFIHDIDSNKIDQRIIEICTELRSLRPDVQFYQSDIKSAVNGAESVLEGITPFSLYEYKRGENTGFFDNGDKAELKTYQAVKEADIKSIEWYVKGIFPKIGSVQLAAEAKAGKSVISEQLAYCFSYGLEFWNTPLPQCEVLLYDLEEGVEDLNKRLEGFEIYYQPETKPKNVYIRNAINQFVPEKEGDLDLFDDLDDELIDHPDIKVIIIDNIKAGLINSDKKARSDNKEEHHIMQRFNRWAEDNRVLLIFTNHTTKDIDKNDPFKSIEGTNSMAGGPKINMVMCKDNPLDEDNLLLFGRTRIGSPFQYNLSKNYIPNPKKNDPNNEEVVFELEEKDDKKYPIDERVIKACQKLLNDNGGKEVKTSSGKIIKIMENSSGLTGKRITSILKKLGGQISIEEYNLNIFLSSNGSGASTWHIKQLF